MKLFITAKVPDQVYSEFDDKFEIEYNDSNIPLSKEQLMKGIKDCEILLCPLSDKIDADVLRAGKKLKLVQNYGAGFDNIDIKTADDLGVSVCNTPAKNSSVSTAELAFLLMLASARNIVGGKSEILSGGFRGWRPTYMLGTQLMGKTLGIIGLGKIGQSLAHKAVAFGMNVIYYSRNRKLDRENENVKYMSKEDVIKNADFLSLNTSYSDELYHMIDEKKFDMMKNTAHIINAARGKLISEKALIKAIEDKKIAGAALDVYEFEPTVSKKLLEFDNVICVPHIGNATYEARLEMGAYAVKNILAYKNGQQLPNKVN